MKLLYVVNQPDTFFSHRLPWAQLAQRSGWTVHVAGPVGGWERRFAAHAFVPHPIPFVRGLGGPGKQVRMARSILEILRQERPDVVHLVGTQVVATVGPLVRAMPGKTGLVSSITGLGHAFLTPGARGVAMRAVTLAGYAVAFAPAPHVAVVFQNPDDVEQVRQYRAMGALAPRIIMGSGVDVTSFVPTPEPAGGVVVMLASRLLAEKGVREFVEAAERLRREHPSVRFVLVGDLDESNPSSITTAEIERWTSTGAVEWWGHSNDMRETLTHSHVVVLPSYREGLPKVLLEAAATARPLVATDVPGCREVVIHGDNGFLAPARDANGLARAIDPLLTDQPLRLRMGARAREIAVATFSADEVARRYLSIYEEVRGAA